MISWCEVPRCLALIVNTDGVEPTGLCSAHTRATFDEETDEERLERVSKTMGWRRWSKK